MSRFQRHAKRFGFEDFAPWFSRAGETRFGMAVLDGHVKNLRTGFFMFLLFSFLGLNFMIFRDFSGALTLAAARKKAIYNFFRLP